MTEWYVCRTCGVEQGPRGTAPDRCPICQDERQYVGWEGQRWATVGELEAEGHRIALREEEPGLLGVGVDPAIGIGQRALLVRTPQGNVLWDCVGFFHHAAADRIRDLGGIAAIAFSHPHFYGAAGAWSRAFGDAPILVPEADRRWFLRTDLEPRTWEGSMEVLPGVTLVQCGGHFDGSAVLHWGAGAGGLGALLVGDTLTVVQDRRYVSFMRSYPNLIPLPRHEIGRIVEAIRPYRFDRIYGGWWDRVVPEGGADAVERSAGRYLRWIGT